jgi:uncharacterized protein (TIGR03067 family)
VKDKLDVLQGEWSVVTLEIGGKAAPVGTSRIVVKGDGFTTSGMGAEYRGRITIQEPNSLDMTFLSGPEKGNTNFGIFEVKKDKWRLCLDMTGKGRPKSFSSKPGIALETLQRATKASRQKTAAKVAFDIVPAPELEGEWAMVSCTVNGDRLPASMAKHGKRVARNNEITVTMSGQTLVKARFTVNRDSVPNSIDYLLPGGEQQHGIYELDGKNLKVIFSAPGKTRPTDFSTAKGDGKTLSTWKLIKQ